MSNDDGSYCFVLPGRPLTIASPRSALMEARQQLQQQVGNLPFPIPADFGVSLKATFRYPYQDILDHAPTILDLTHIAKEICIGILFVDHSGVKSKNVQREVAATGDEGSTVIMVGVV